MLSREILFATIVPRMEYSIIVLIIKKRHAECGTVTTEMQIIELI